MMKLLIVAAILCAVDASARGNHLKKGKAVEEMPNRHKNINGFKLGRPVKIMDSFKTTGTQQYLEMLNYGAAGCAGDPIQVASVATGVCYQTQEPIYVDDDEYDVPYYYFYGGFYDDDFWYGYFNQDDAKSNSHDDHAEGSADHHHSSKKKHASSTSSNRHLREQREQEGHARNQPKPQYHSGRFRGTDPDGSDGYAIVHSVEYSVVSETVAGVTYYLLTTNAYFAADCTGKSTSYTTTLENQCYDYPTYSDDLFDDGEWYWYDDYYLDDNSADGKQAHKDVAVVTPRPSSIVDDFYTNYTYDDYFYNYTNDDDNYFDDNYGSYYYYDFTGHGLSMITTVSSTPFTLPTGAGVLTEYFYDQDVCKEAEDGVAEPAPYTVWDAAGACLTNAAWMSTSIDYCNDGIAYSTEWFLTSDCNSHHTYSAESYSSCFWIYQNVQCTGTWPASNVPTMQPTNPHSAVAMFTVAQTLQNVSKDDMDDSASVNAFTTAVMQSLDSTYVTEVDIDTVTDKTTASSNAFINRFFSESSSAACDVSYSVTFSCTTDVMSNCYDQLTSQLSSAVTSGTFQDYLQTAAANDPNCPASLKTCGAMTSPSISGYTVLSTDDDYDDGSSNSHKKGVPVATVASVSVVGALVVAGTIVGWYFMRSKAAQSQATTSTTTTVGMTTMNPTYASSGGGGVPPQPQYPYPQQMELGAVPAVPYSGASSSAQPLPVIRSGAVVANPMSPAGPMHVSAVDIGAHEVVGNPAGLHPV